jgi:hypothetical protein
MGYFFTEIIMYALNLTLCFIWGDILFKNHQVTMNPLITEAGLEKNCVEA